MDAWVSVDGNGQEVIYDSKPVREVDGYSYWVVENDANEFVFLPYGSIKRLIGRVLTWEDEPVKLDFGMEE